MRKYLLPQNSNSYKANLHTHSTLSDGKFTPEEIKKYYMEHGYSIIAYTDHDIFIPHNDLTDDSFLALNGYELEVNQRAEDASAFTHNAKTCHMCMVALDPDKVTPVCWHREKYLFGNAVNHRDEVKNDPNVPDYTRVYSGDCVSDMMRLGRENGFFVTYNHPTWSCEDYGDYINYHNMHAMEMVNYGCVIAGYPDHNERVYDDMLRGGERIFCTATDDCHAQKDMCGSYVVIKADKLEYKAVTDALLNGAFYSSEAPEIKELYIEDGKVTVKTSEAAEIRFSTGIRNSRCFLANGDALLTEATYELPTDKDPYYFRVTVADKNGKFAYTNAFFTDELSK